MKKKLYSVKIRETNIKNPKILHRFYIIAQNKNDASILGCDIYRAY